MKVSKREANAFSKNVALALDRARLAAHKIARMYGTPIYIWRDGKVVAIKPKDATLARASARNDVAEFEKIEMNGELFTKVRFEANLSARLRKWIGNDDSQRHHHGLVNFDDQPLDIVLKWKSSSISAPRLIGYYRLYLQNLRAAKYISEPRNGKIRLRFCHASDDCIYIQSLAPKSPALLIGKFTAEDTN